MIQQGSGVFFAHLGPEAAPSFAKKSPDPVGVHLTRRSPFTEAEPPVRAFPGGAWERAGRASASSNLNFGVQPF